MGSDNLETLASVRFGCEINFLLACYFRGVDVYAARNPR